MDALASPVESCEDLELGEGDQPELAGVALADIVDDVQPEVGVGPRFLHLGFLQPKDLSPDNPAECLDLDQARWAVHIGRALAPVVLRGSAFLLLAFDDRVDCSLLDDLVGSRAIG